MTGAETGVTGLFLAAAAPVDISSWPSLALLGLLAALLALDDTALVQSWLSQFQSK